MYIHISHTRIDICKHTYQHRQLFEDVYHKAASIVQPNAKPSATITIIITSIYITLYVYVYICICCMPICMHTYIYIYYKYYIYCTILHNDL